MKSKLVKAVLTGFISALTITSIVYFFSFSTSIQINFPNVFTELMAPWYAIQLKTHWLLEFGFHLFSATVLISLLFTNGVFVRLYRLPRMKGIYWGIFLWLILQLVLLPIIGAGVFALNTAHPLLLILGSLLIYLLYGGILEEIVKKKSKTIV